jgi:hypothetical protein
MVDLPTPGAPRSMMAGREFAKSGLSIRVFAEVSMMFATSSEEVRLWRSIAVMSAMMFSFHLVAVVYIII